MSSSPGPAPRTAAYRRSSSRLDGPLVGSSRLGGAARRRATSSSSVWDTQPPSPRRVTVPNLHPQTDTGTHRPTPLTLLPIRPSLRLSSLRLSQMRVSGGRRARDRQRDLTWGAAVSACTDDADRWPRPRRRHRRHLRPRPAPPPTPSHAHTLTTPSAGPTTTLTTHPPQQPSADTLTLPSALPSNTTEAPPKTNLGGASDLSYNGY